MLTATWQVPSPASSPAQEHLQLLGSILQRPTQPSGLHRTWAAAELKLGMPVPWKGPRHRRLSPNLYAVSTLLIWSPCSRACPQGLWTQVHDHMHHKHTHIHKLTRPCILSAAFWNPHVPAGPLPLSTTFAHPFPSACIPNPPLTLLPLRSIAPRGGRSHRQGNTKS